MFDSLMRVVGPDRLSEWEAAHGPFTSQCPENDPLLGLVSYAMSYGASATGAPQAPAVAPPGKRRVNKATVDLVKHFEGLFTLAYLCPAGVPTIGYGHTETVTGHDVGRKHITEQEAEALLESDLNEFAAGVDHAVIVPTNENQFGALVSFAFNLGIGSLTNSTLLRKLVARDATGASKEFARWRYAQVNGVATELPGLVRRREAERALFMTKP